MSLDGLREPHTKRTAQKTTGGTHPLAWSGSPAPQEVEKPTDSIRPAPTLLQGTRPCPGEWSTLTTLCWSSEHWDSTSFAHIRKILCGARAQLDMAGPGSHSAALCDGAHTGPWELLRSHSQPSQKPQTSEGLRATQQSKPPPATARHQHLVSSPTGRHRKF